MWCALDLPNPDVLLLDQKNPVSFECPGCGNFIIKGYKEACPSCRTDLRRACYDILNSTTGLARCLDAIKNRHEYTTSRLDIPRHLSCLKNFHWQPCQVVGLVAQAVIAHRFCLELLYGDKVPSASVAR